MPADGIIPPTGPRGPHSQLPEAVTWKRPSKVFEVLEVANWLAIPSCAAMMADMGADVIKVEALQGDTFRTEIRDADFGKAFPISYAFELDNRGKRSIALNLARPKAVEAVHKLASQSRCLHDQPDPPPPGSLQPNLRRAFKGPFLASIYVSFNGYGTEGPDKDRTGFDYTAFWTRSGAMSLFSRPGKEPVNLRSGFGDHTSSPMLLAGVMTALWAREKTGRGQKVACSLLNMGLWVIGGDLSRSLYAQQHPFQWTREESPNPLQNTYQTGDGKWINMVSPNTNEKWARFCRALERYDLITDERYSEPLARRANARELIQSSTVSLLATPSMNSPRASTPKASSGHPCRTSWTLCPTLKSAPTTSSLPSITPPTAPTRPSPPLLSSAKRNQTTGRSPRDGSTHGTVLVDELGYSWMTWNPLEKTAQ